MATTSLSAAVSGGAPSQLAMGGSDGADAGSTAQYIEVAAAHEASLVLVTPPPRNSAYCTGGNGTGAHAEAMRELAAERGVALSDLNAKSVAYLQAICPAPMPEDFFLLRADGSVDGTHFQEQGARKLAQWVAQGLLEAAVPVASFITQP